jgi:hypothetical protein
MSGSTVNTPTAVSNTAVVAKSIVVERLCIVFGKSYEEVVDAIQSEMTAMEQEFQSWKLQLGDRGDDNKKIEPKTKKAPAKPRAKKADADVASSAIVNDGVEGAESAVDASASAATETTKSKKAPAKPRAKKADLVDSSAVVTDGVEGTTTTEAAEPKTKKAPAKPRAKKADVVPLNVSAEDAVVNAEAAAEPKAKKAPAKPRAKKADADVSASESATPSSEEPKAKKNAAAAKPRSKKSAEVVVAAPVVEVENTQKDSELTEDQFEEVEVEVVEFEFEGVHYLRGKADNKLYDPETSDVIGVWNEATGQIDECSEEQDDE